MNAAALPRPTSGLDLPAALARPTVLAAVIAAAAVALRLPLFGDPIHHIDEQFYLLAGDRLLDGRLPFVDVWDRKPFGLFLLYAAIRLLPGDGVLAYQLVSTAFAAATGFTVALIARRFTDGVGALCGGVLYVLALGIVGGGGGQSPVFYNLPVAVAALLVLRVVEAPAERRARDGALAMLLMGVAIQIKYTALFEGAFLGLTLLWATRSQPLPRLAAAAAGFAALGVAPTAAALALYAALGHFDAFWYANFVSIFDRVPLSAGEQADNLFRVALFLSPVLALTAAGLIRGPRPAGSEGRAAWRFLLGWAGTAVLGFVAFGGYYDHYALPLLTPFAAIAAAACRSGGFGALCVAALLFSRLAFFHPISLQSREQDRALADELVAATAPFASHCMLVFSHQIVVQHLTGACAVTRYMFPEHLLIERERDAIGTDQLAELRRALDRKPGVVIAGPSTFQRPEARSIALLHATLARDYSPVLRGRRLDWEPERVTPTVYVRRDLLNRTRP